MRWFLGTLLLLLEALVLESGLLAYATYVLLALLLLSRVLARGWSENVHATRQLTQPRQGELSEDAGTLQTGPTLHAEIGDRINVRVLVRNTGWLPVPWMLLEDLLPLGAMRKDARLKVTKGKHVRISMLRPGGEKLLRYQL